MIYKFVKWDIPELDTLKDTRIYQLHDKLIVRKEKATREDKDYLFNLLDTFNKRGVKLHGWMFDFSSILKEYWVQFTYGDIFVYFALDKTSIRNDLYTSRVRKIVEIK